jgi:hypothetical protein
MGVPDSNVSMDDLLLLMMTLNMAGPPYVVIPVPPGMDCADLSGPRGSYPDGALSTSDMATMVIYLASLGPPYVGPCMPPPTGNDTSSATIYIQVNGMPWDGGDVHPDDVIMVTWQDDVEGYGGFGDFSMSISDGMENRSWLVAEGWQLDPYFDVVPRASGGLDVKISAVGNPSPTGDIFYVEFIVPEYDPGSEDIIIDPCEGSWNGAFGVPGPDDPLPYAVLHVAPEQMDMDFADAPDPNYATLLASDGARHDIVPGIYLGSGVDAEPDGQPDPDALGDDNDGNDDEDGVVFTSPLIPGQAAMVDVNASVAGSLTAWVDFDCNGVWDYNEEMIFVGEPLNAGINHLMFSVPVWAVADANTYARFRFVTDPVSLMDWGPAPNGEVEDYKVRIGELLAIKWEQLPDPQVTGYHCHDSHDGISYQELHIADDWLCEGGVVTDLHWWGNYENADANTWGFRISIYGDAGGTPDLWAGPLWMVDAPLGPGPGEVHETPSGPPYVPWSMIYYEYYLLDPFVQLEGEVYWLDLMALSMDPQDPALWHWQGNAEPIILSAPVQWTPPDYTSELDINMAFRITSEDEEPIPPKPPVPHLKWSQPPIEIEPAAPTPVYCGWNEESHREIISFESWGPDWPCQCWGDADNSGRVDNSDYLAVKKAMNSSYPDPGYDPGADFDRNLVVNHLDWAIMKSHFGQMCPPDPGCAEWKGSLPTTDAVEYWDLFAVSLSPNGMYWDLVNGGAGANSDPLLYPDPAGAPVTAVEPNTPLGGVVWGFGGLDWGDSTLESDSNTHSIELMGAADYYLSVVLDTATNPQADGHVPSWGTVSDIVVRPWEGTNWGSAIDIQNWMTSPYDPDGGTMVSAGTSSSITLAANDFAKQELDDQAGTGIWGAAAQLPPADGYKVEFTTDVSTWDSYDDEGPEARVKWDMVADDFRCLGTMPVTSVHWWGSYLGWEGSDQPEVLPEGWHIGFWSNIPEGADADYSHPGRLLWQVKVPAERVQVEHVGEDYFPDVAPESCFQYYLKFAAEVIRDERFWQYEFLDETADDTFWISITALYPFGSPPVDHPWGWKTRPWSWMDDAVTISLADEPNESTVLDPRTDPNVVKPIEYEGESYDVAFELDTDPNWIKWEQPFTGIRHWPHYEDEKSIAIIEPTTGEPNIIRLVADDWPCDHNGAVSSVVWWGSYIGYRYEACQGIPPMPPEKPEYFLLQIWDDVPVGAEPFSHPGNIIWEYRAYEYDEVLVGYDKHPEFEPPIRTEPVFRYSVRLPEEEWFCQEKAEGVYWLSIVAVYSQSPVQPWGWTNHKYAANDNAVAGYLDTGLPIPEWQWEELFDQTGESEDMSFMLFTECMACSHPDFGEWLRVDRPRCWCYLTQCHGDSDDTGDVKGSDFLALKNSWYKIHPDPAYNACADFDHNGEVKGSDFLILKGHWYQTVDPNCHEDM